MPNASDITRGYADQKWHALASRFWEEWGRMRLVDAWWTKDETVLKSLVWAGVPQQDWGKITIYKSTVISVLDSVTALASTPDPKMLFKMRNRKAVGSRNNAKYLERAALSMRAELNRGRPSTFESEVYASIFRYGVAITKRIHLPPDERGEERRRLTGDEQLALEPNAPVIRDPVSGETEMIEREGAFPFDVEVLNPLDCVYIAGPSHQGVAVFVHRYYAQPDDLREIFPDITDDPDFSWLKETSAATELEVLDYWDREYHAIFIQGHEYLSPKEHNLRRLPFEVERVKEQERRHAVTNLPTTSPSTSTAVTSASRFARVATPFVWAMLDDVTKASFGESILASYLPSMASSPIIHQGIASGYNGTASSPYFQRVQYEDGRVERVPRYRFRGDKTAGGRPVWPLFDQENMYPLNPTPIAEHMQLFIQQRNFDMELVGMSAELLTGRIRSEPSGFSVNQQVQLSSARGAPYLNAGNSLISKTYSGIVADLTELWDRADVPLIFLGLTGEEDVEITREMLQGVSEVIYSVERIFPRDFQSDMQLNLQLAAAGGMSQRKLIEEANREDPDEALKQMAWERMAFQDPSIMMALARVRHAELGYGELGPSPEAQQAAAAQQEAVMMAQEAQMAQQVAEQQPAQPPQAAPAGGNGAGGEVPPELLAALLGGAQ